MREDSPRRTFKNRKVRFPVTQFFSAFRRRDPDYARLRCTARGTLKQAELSLLLTAFLYKLGTSVLFVPALQQLWALTLRLAPMHYLNNRNASDIYASPAIVGGIALLAVLSMLWMLFGYALVLNALHRVRQHEPLAPLPLLRDSLSTVGRALLPRNWGVLLYCTALLPLTGFFLAWNHITQLAVPEYLLGLLRSRPFLQPVTAAVVLLIFVLCLYWVLVLPLFVVEKQSFPQAVRQSTAWVRQHTGQQAGLLVRWELSAFLRAGALSGIVLLVLYGGSLAVGLISTSGMVALSRAMLLIEVPFFKFFIDFRMFLAQCLLVSGLFCLQGAEPDPAPETVSLPLCRRLLVLALAGTTFLTGCLSLVYFALPEDHDLRSMLGGAMPIVTAHRGYSSAAPENTLAAFQAAIDAGCERAELDVQMTKDGVLVVTHDTSLRRCTGLIANIYDVDYDSLSDLSAGRWFSKKYAGEHIPTLMQVLELCKGKIQLNIEIKPDPAMPGLEEKTVQEIYEAGFEHDCVITSQSYETLCKVKELAPEIPTGYILALGVGSYYDLPAADFFSIESTFITSGMVQQIHLRGKTVSAWTINRQSDASELLKMGVDDLITDKPEMVQALLDETQPTHQRLLTARDALRQFFFPDKSQPDPTEETIEDAIEDPDELLDEA